MPDEMDNVEWLRKSSSEEWCGSALNKCADEITILRGRVEALNAERDRLWVEKLKTQGEITHLRWLVEKAYYEGWWDNFHPDMKDTSKRDWETSAAAAAIREGGKDD